MAKQRKTKSTAPVALSARAEAFREHIAGAFVLERQHQELLLEAARCLERIDQAREAIAVDGLFTSDRFGQPKAHPAVEVEATNRRLFRSLVRELGLDAGEAEDYARGPKAPTIGHRRAG